MPMLIGTIDGGFVTKSPDMPDICDGCKHRPAHEHQCTGTIGSEIPSRFPDRDCQCPDCKNHNE